MRSLLVLLLLAGVPLAAPACGSDVASERRPPRAAASPATAVRALGEAFRCPAGEFLVIRLQDEFRLLRLSHGEAIEFSLETVFRLERHRLDDGSRDEPGLVRWNTWIEIPAVPGLSLRFLHPEAVAFRWRAPDAGP